MDEIIVKVVYTKLLINTHTHCSNAVSSISWNGGNKYKDTRYMHTYIYYICTFIHTEYIHMYIHTYVHTYIHKLIHIHTYIITYIHNHKPSLSGH